MSENIVYFKMKHEEQTQKIPIQGVNIQLKDLRQKIKEFLRMPQPIKGQSNQNYEELVIYAESELGIEKALGLADKVRNKQTVIVVRQPYQYGQSYCDSCFASKSSSQTPCCQKRICQQCEEQFIKFAKCFFNEIQQCSFKYANYQVQTKQQTEISNYDLEQQIKNAVFYIVKSNTEQNVILAKNHDVWATTRRNFGTLMSEFNNKHKVILIFIANRVEKFLGCAKMKNIQVPRDPKWQWHGTSTIQLADNFSIEWLRKGSVDFTKLQDTINPKTGDLVIRSKDCQEVPSDIGQRICLLFEQIKQNDEECEPLPQPEQPINDNEWDVDQILSPVKDSPIQEPKPKSKSPSPSQKSQNQQPQLNMQNFALLNSIITPLYQQQQMEMNWNKMNVGKIPGLTGKVQYPHPFLQKYNQKTSKLAEALILSMVNQQGDDKKDKEKEKEKDKQRDKRSSSKEKKHKKKKDKDRSRSSSEEKRRKKSKDRKDKKSKHKKHSRSRSRDHKKKKH